MRLSSLERKTQAHTAVNGEIYFGFMLDKFVGQSVQTLIRRLCPLRKHAGDAHAIYSDF